MEKAKTGSELLLRSALARRDYWVSERRDAMEKNDEPRAVAASRFVAEYDALISDAIEKNADCEPDSTA